MQVIAIDCSHRDRPNLTFKASEVISSRDGTMILGAHAIIELDDHPVTSISNLQRDILQGFDLHLSHDWTVKAHD